MTDDMGNMDTRDNIETLTDEQEHLMATLANEYEERALSGDDSYDVDEIRKGVDFIYNLAEIPSPEIVICTSPLDMAEQAKLKKGETFDWIGNGYDSGWTAFYEFMERIGVEYEKDWQFDAWRDFIVKSGVFATILCENVAFVCIRPCDVLRNSSFDLHGEKSMAIAWRDGYGEYFLNGVSVDEELVMTPAEKIDPKILLKEKNAEIRREIVRKIGIERVVHKLGAEVIDKKDDYELLLIDLQDGRKREYLKMKNPSIDVWHVEGVLPGIRTVKEALAWRNGLDAAPAKLS